MVSLKEYKKLIEERPRKFSAEEVDYRDGAEELPCVCSRCIHFFERARDKFAVCEVMRPTGEESVDQFYTCDMYSPDGEKFPLYPGSR